LAPAFFSEEIIRIHPQRIINWHIDPDRPEDQARNVTT
jgi:pyridoxamine 5'-phosphate oxidase family protein